VFCDAGREADRSMSSLLSSCLKRIKIFLFNRKIYPNYFAFLMPMNVLKFKTVSPS
jgi:hypothetical protein